MLTQTQTESLKVEMALWFCRHCLLWVVINDKPHPYTFHFVTGKPLQSLDITVTEASGTKVNARQRWANWLIGAIWLGTIFAAVITLRIHPATAVTAALTVRRFSFHTNANRILVQKPLLRNRECGPTALRDRGPAEAPINQGGKRVCFLPHTICSSG
jgi:hypothetical protein